MVFGRDVEYLFASKELVKNIFDFSFQCKGNFFRTLLVINFLLFYKQSYLFSSQPYFFSVNFVVFGIKFLINTVFYDIISHIFVTFIDFFKHKLSLLIPISHIYQESYTYNSLSFSSHNNFIKNVIFKENNFFDNLNYFIFHGTTKSLIEEDTSQICEIIVFIIAVILPFISLHKYWKTFFNKRKIILDKNFKFLVKINFFFNSFTFFRLLFYHFQFISYFLQECLWD